MTSSGFDQLAVASDLALTYNGVIRTLVTTPLWTSGSAKERRILWTDAGSARDMDSLTFKLPGLYIWGAKDRPVYIGKTGSSFKQRFCRYIWSQRSQCNLARDFETALIEKGIHGFPAEIHEWYEGYGGSTVRLEGAVRFATEGISEVWFALFPASDAKRIRPLEKALIPVAHSWNVQAGIKPLLNIESNRRVA